MSYPRSTTGSKRKRNRVEYDRVQWPITKALRELGLYVTTIAQPQRVKATPGVPDLYVRSPRYGLRLWIECKRPEVRNKPRQGLSVEQVQWIDTERKSGGQVLVAYCLDDVLNELRNLKVIL